MWTVPAKRMKSNREHRVPLCGRALELLRRRLMNDWAAYLAGENQGPEGVPIR